MRHTAFFPLQEEMGAMLMPQAASAPETDDGVGRLVGRAGL